VPVIVTVEVPVVAVAEADKVSVEDALPPEGGVTDAGLNEAVTPLGSPEAERLVAALKPLRLVTVVVLVPLPPWATLTEVGEVAIEKFGTGAAVTVSETLKTRVVLPLTPWAWNVEVPVAAEPETATVSVLFTLPFAGGVTEAGL
jgi:hypothetical protein